MKERAILFSAPMVRAILEDRKTVTRRLVRNPRDRNGSGLAVSRMRSFPHVGQLHDGSWMFADVPKSEWSQALPESHLKGGGLRSPYGGPGDRLWVRETWGSADHYYQDHENDDPSVVAYAADRSAIQFHAKAPRPIPSWDIAQWNWDKMRWRPSIHMPRWASRITLDVIDVRVERLQDITEDDAKAEGTPRVEGDPDEYPCLSCDLGVGPKLPKGSIGCADCSNSGVSCARAHFAALWDSISAEGAKWQSNPWVWRVDFKRVGQ